MLRIIPGSILNRGRVRAKLSSIIAKLHKFTGYFQIYNVPFKHLPLFDYAEKQSIWVKNGLNQGKNIFDYLDKEEVPYYVPQGYFSDEKNFSDLKSNIESASISIAYITLGKLDGVMHRMGTKGKEIDDTITNYHIKIKELLDSAKNNYDDVNIYVFSDHGMHDVIKSFNLIEHIEKLDLNFGKDYVAMYDSTMARFWFLNDKGRAQITESLKNLDCGKNCRRSQT